MVEPGCARWSAMLGGFLRRRTDRGNEDRQPPESERGNGDTQLLTRGIGGTLLF